MTKEPTILDDYELVEELGSGAFATVHKARPVGLKNTFVALKVAKPGHEERLKAEAEVYDQLHHPHIVNIARVKDDYIAMDYMPGTLRDVLDENKKGIDYKRALNIASQVASALEHVHEKGLVHKDIKPEAILLDDGFVKISDFNLSKIIEAEEKNVLRESLMSTTDPKLSLFGGTIGYMSPEQQNQEPVDEKSDSWSLGVVLYEMLTGNRPSGNYPKPSEVNRHIPKWVDDLVDSCLIPDAADRYQSTGIRTHIEDGLAGKLDPVPEKPKKSLKDSVSDFFTDNSILKGIINHVNDTDYTALDAEEYAIFAKNMFLKTLKYTIGLPLVPAILFGKKAIKYSGTQDAGFFIGLSVLSGFVLGISGYIAAPLIGANIYADRTLKNELKDATGKIAYFTKDKVVFFDAANAVKEDRKETELFPQAQQINDIMWKNSQEIYFVAETKTPDTTGKAPPMPKQIPQKRIHSLNKLHTDGTYEVMVEDLQKLLGDKFGTVHTPQLRGAGTIDGKDVIYLNVSGSSAPVIIGEDGSLLEKTMAFGADIRNHQRSPDGKFKLVRSDVWLDLDIEYSDAGFPLSWADLDLANDAKGASWYHGD